MILLTILKWVLIIAAAVVILCGLLLFVSMVSAVIVMVAKGEHPERYEETDGDHEA